MRFFARAILCASIISGTVLAATPQPRRASAAPPAGKPAFAGKVPLVDRQWRIDPAKFTFIVVGDKTGGGEGNWPIFDRAIDEINLLNPDFAIMIGDLIQGYSRDTTEIAAMWGEFRQHVERIRVPFLFLPGNHDVSYPEMLAYWKRTNGATYYSFDYGGAHFLVLNSEEDRGTFGREQLEFIRRDLARSRNARHTFLFMHKPAWGEEGYAREWTEIETALGDRSYTAFGGHWHHLEYTEKNGNRRIAVGPTGAGQVLSDVKGFGAFHHYTHVSMDGDSAHIAFIEPGHVLPQDIAPRAFRQAVYGLVTLSPLPPEGLGGGNVTTGMAATIRNDLPDTATVVVRIADVAESGWSFVEGSPLDSVVVAPGDSARIVARFSAPANRLTEVPRVGLASRYEGAELFAREQRIPVFPDTILRAVPRWEIVGPFSALPIHRNAMPDWRAAMPRAFAELGPEKGWSPSASYPDEGEWRMWKEVEARDDGLVIFDGVLGVPTPVNALAYALAGVWSPDRRTVIAELREDDFAQIITNGTLLEDGRLFRSRRDVDYVAIPLERGWNTVIAKVVNISGGWSFRLRLADPEKELRFAPHPERAE